jgi:hypothetical protein
MRFGHRVVRSGAAQPDLYAGIRRHRIALAQGIGEAQLLSLADLEPPEWLLPKVCGKAMRSR